MKNEKKLKLPAKAAIWYAASVVLGRGITLIFTPIFTRVLSPEEYGLYTLFTSWLAILTIPATLEITGSVFMRAKQKHSEKDGTLDRSALFLIFLITLTFCALYFAFLALFPDISMPHGTLAILIFVQILCASVVNVYLASAKFRYRYKTVFIINSALGLITAPLALFLIAKMSFPEWARIISQVITYSVTAIILLIIIFKKGFKISTSYMKEMLVPAAFLLPHYLSVALISRIDKLVIGAKFGEGALARYSVADTIGSLTIFAMGALFSALTPWILRKISAKRHDKVKLVCSHTVSIIAAVTVGLSCVAPELLAILAPKEYGEALFAFYPIALSAIPYFVFTVYSAGFTHASLGWVTSLPSILGAITASAAAALIGAAFPYKYISLAIPAAYLIMCAASFIIYRRRTGESLVPEGFAALSFVLTAAALFVSYILRNHFVPRVIIALLAALPALYKLKGVSAELIEKNE